VEEDVIRSRLYRADVAPIRVRVIADRMLTDLLAHTFAAEPDMVAVDLGADVAVLDAASCRGGWPEAIDELRAGGADPHVVVLATDDDVDAAVTAARARVVGWVPPGAAVEDLVAVVRLVAGGGGTYSPRHLGAVLRALWADVEQSDQVADRLASLTERERHVLRLLVEGLAAREIAGRMALSVNTVRTHTRRTFRKLGVHHRLEAVRVARSAGLLPFTDQ